MKKLQLFALLMATSFASMAQVGFGTTTPEAVLDVVASNSGVLVPRVANAAAVTHPINGMIVYDLSINCLNFYENNAWTGCLDPNAASNAVLAQIGSEADAPDATNSVVTVAQLQSIVPAISGLNAADETAYQDYIDANPALFSNPATQAEVQAMVEAVNSAAVLVQIGSEADDPDATNSVVTISQLASIVPAINGLNAANERAYQNYIDANPALFSSPATQAEVQAMVDVVNSSATVLAQIGSEADAPDATNSVVTVAQLASIFPAISGLDAANETAYQDYIDANPALFSNPATQAQVQAMVDAVNSTATVLAQIGSEADAPDATNSVVTVTQLASIVPAISGLDAANETPYQDYIDANPALFSNPATQAEVQAMVGAVNSSATVLAQIGGEADAPDTTNSVVMVAQLASIVPAINGLNAANETAYQDYIDANPALFSSPATQAEVQAMVDAVNSSATVLAQIGSEADAPDATNSVVTVAQLASIVPAINGLNAANETAYQDYIDANPALFINPATQAEVQAMVDAVNSSATVLAQIGSEADDPDATNSVVTVTQLGSIVPAVSGLDAANETAYQDYIDANPALFSNPATQAEVQAMVDAVNSSATVLAQIGGEADAPDATNSVVTLAQLANIVPALTGVLADKEADYQNYIDGNPALFSNPATQAEVQAMLNAITATDVVGPNGNIWMDRNLGASQVATSSTDADAYGDLYQWGREADGHESRTSSSTTTTSAGNSPGHGNFIIGSNDWRTTSNNNLWQGVNGTNNPCPTGYRVPTEAEWNGLGITNAATAFSSPLNLSRGGFRGSSSSSSFSHVGSIGFYWTSNVSGSSSRYINFSSSAASFNANTRIGGFTVRCIKD